MEVSLCHRVSGVDTMSCGFYTAVWKPVVYSEGQGKVDVLIALATESTHEWKVKNAPRSSGAEVNIDSVCCAKGPE